MSDGSSRKPTPVRETLTGTGPGDEVDFASLEFEVDGAEWVVEELGWTRSGRREDAGAPLLLLGFRLRGVEEVEREAWVSAPRLADVPDRSLPSILASARPYPGRTLDRPFFASAQGRTRDGRGRGRRNRSRD